MKPFSDLAVQHFDFLATRHGFTRTVVSEEEVRYESERVYFEIAISARDADIDVSYGRFGQPGQSSAESAECLSLGVFLGAIRTHLGTFHEESISDFASPDYAEQTLAELAS